MTPRSPSVGFRAVLALGLMIGFYALALGLAGALLWVPYAVFNYAHRIPAKLALCCLAGAAIIYYSIHERRAANGKIAVGLCDACCVRSCNWHCHQEGSNQPRSHHIALLRTGHAARACILASPKMLSRRSGCRQRQTPRSASGAAASSLSR